MRDITINREEYYSFEELKEFVDLSNRSFQMKFKKTFSKNELKMFTGRIGALKYYHFSLLQSCMTPITYKAVRAYLEANKKMTLIERRNPVVCINSYRNKLRKRSTPNKSSSLNNILAERLKLINWSYFITISPLNKTSGKTCFDKNKSFFDNLELIANSNNVMLYSCEPHEISGYHSHLLVKTNIPERQFKKEVLKSFPFCNRKIENYIPQFGAENYILKSGLENEMWDLLGAKS